MFVAVLLAIQTMTLPEALTYAEQHQPSLAAARARVEAARADARIPRAAWSPRLAAAAEAFEATDNNTTAAYLGAPGVDLPRVGGSRTETTANWKPYPSTLAGIGVRQELFDSGRTAALEASFDALTDAERERQNVERLDLRLAVTEAFVAVRTSHQIQEAARAAVTRAQFHRDLADAGLKSGLRKPIDLSRATADLERAKLGLVRAQGGLAGAQAVFAAIVGGPFLTLDAAGDVPEPTNVPDAAAAVKQALERDPQLHQLNDFTRAQQARTKAIGRELLPDISLTGSLNTRAGGAQPSAGDALTGWNPSIPNWDVGVLFSWPLFDRTVIARKSASQAREVALDAESRAAAQRLAARVQQAVVEASSMREALPALQASEAAAKVNQEQADARFRAGLGTSVELADAEALLTDAEIQLAVGKFEAARAAARLARALSEEP